MMWKDHMTNNRTHSMITIAATNTIHAFAMPVCYICGKTLRRDLNARAVSAHIRECEKKNGKKKRFSYIPVEQRIAAESSTSQLPAAIIEDDLPDLPGSMLPDDGPVAPQPEVLQPRRRRLPAKFIDHVISLPQFHNVTQLQQDEVELEQGLTPEITPSPSPQPGPVEVMHDTAPDSFGIFRRYAGRSSLPSRDSDETQAVDYACDASTFDNVQQAEEEQDLELAENDPRPTTPGPQSDEKAPYHPFSNPTCYRLISWFYGNPVKTVEDFQHLIDEILLSPDYRIEDIEGMDVKRELKRLDEATIPFTATTDIDPLFPPSEGWEQLSVTIRLPPPNARFKLKREDDAPTVTVDGIHHRSLLEGITRAFTCKSFFDFHLKGFQLWWKPSEGEDPQQVFGEVYSSVAFLELEKKIPPLSEQDVQDGVRESVLAPIMLYSDATRLANFGTASLWPIYMYIGLLSQYMRSKKSSLAAFHLAYLASVCLQIFCLFQSI
jgi:hypothetical protein